MHWQRYENEFLVEILKYRYSDGGVYLYSLMSFWGNYLMWVIVMCRINGIEPESWCSYNILVLKLDHDDDKKYRHS